jgi:hypothetical protein
LDPVEAKDLSKTHPEKFEELKQAYDAWAKDFDI